MEETISKWLKPEEKILWVGKCQLKMGGQFLVDLALVLVLLFVAIVVYFLAIGALEYNIFHLLFLVLAAYALSIRLTAPSYASRMKDTVYAVTQERALAATKKEVQSISLNSISTAHIVDNKEGVGTIVFNRSRNLILSREGEQGGPFRGSPFTWLNLPSVNHLAFVNIQNPEKVLSLILRKE